METQTENKKQQITLPPPDSVSPPPPNPDSSPPHSNRNSGDHISISPPHSPASSLPSPLHNSGDHISISPPATSPVLGNSPARSSLSSDHISINPSPPRNQEPNSQGPPPPAAVFREPVENKRVVLEEPMAVVSRAVLKEEPKAAVSKIDTGVAAGDGGGGGGERRRSRPSVSVLGRGEREKMVRRAALGFRVFGMLFCLVSFSVMAADRNRGWAIDSFDRYIEFRYCMSVNVIGFVYSAAQAFDLSYNLATGKYIVDHQQRFRYYLDFAADQMIAYLLISASSSAAIRVDDWQSNWGKDKFPDMATASISMSFLAFAALAATSLISGYALCTSKSF